MLENLYAMMMRTTTGQGPWWGMGVMDFAFVEILNFDWQEKP